MNQWKIVDLIIAAIGILWFVVGRGNSSPAPAPAASDFINTLATTTTTANRTNYNNTSNQTTNVPVTLNTYQATGFGSSVYGAGATTTTSQPLSALQLG